jgi:hypothetical protein
MTSLIARNPCFLDIPPAHFEGDLTENDLPFEESQPRGSSCWGNFKLVFFTVTLIAPVRCILCCLLLLLVCLISKIVTLQKITLESPLSLWQQLLCRLMMLLMRIHFFIGGYYYIPVKGQLDSRARIIVMNHVSMFDVFFLQFARPWS